MCKFIRATKQGEQCIERDETKLEPGFSKITSCRRQAARDGCDYVWIDTCCIDKSSSAELSEAINSMYTWYSASKFCYAYLSDLPTGCGPASEEQRSTFSDSRWLTRGWTLQELLAPENVIFFASDWSYFGTRGSQSMQMYAEAPLTEWIASTTSIDSGAMVDRDLSPYSVAPKMSWALQRKPTQMEDMGYCLLGLFDVNMPLLCGEGHRAFKRLQEEIIRNTDDHTIFAWDNDVKPSARLDSFLAPSPLALHSAASTVQSTSSTSHRPYVIANKGPQIELDLCRGEGVLAVLDCTYASRMDGRVAVYLEAPWSQGDSLLELTMPPQNLHEKRGN